MTIDDINKNNLSKKKPEKIHKYCEHCRQDFLVNDYTRKCPVCKEFLSYSKLNDSNKPKCPTCGSTNIQKISDLRKAGGAILFGIFSKDAKSQFECRNCGYKW